MYNYTILDPGRCFFVEVGAEEELPNGERIFLALDDKDIVIFNVAGVYYAIADLCSHDDGPLGDGELKGTEIACPRHGAHFDLVTGKALSLPAVEDIPAYPVRVVDGKIQIGLPADE
ncbi:MAG: non-heme iron oxygenase ferredoxin subunit [Anaerolineales bacterium]|jgi:3-phenylpropionate/trans-cinnamate dioxygenase ferredoxin subunit